MFRLTINYTPVANDETVTRSIVASSWFAQKGGVAYVKQDAFVPYPNVEFYVIRRMGLEEPVVWRLAKQVAELRNRTFYGRADVNVESFINEGLSVSPSPTEANPNHAEVFKWPKEKEAQKVLALQIAADAKFIIAPIL